MFEEKTKEYCQRKENKLFAANRSQKEVEIIGKAFFDGALQVITLQKMNVQVLLPSEWENLRIELVGTIQVKASCHRLGKMFSFTTERSI